MYFNCSAQTTTNKSRDISQPQTNEPNLVCHTCHDNILNTFIILSEFGFQLFFRWIAACIGLGRVSFASRWWIALFHACSYFVSTKNCLNLSCCVFCLIAYSRTRWRRESTWKKITKIRENQFKCYESILSTEIYKSIFIKKNKAEKEFCVHSRFLLKRKCSRYTFYDCFFARCCVMQANQLFLIIERIFYPSLLPGNVHHFVEHV